MQFVIVFNLNDYKGILRKAYKTIREAAPPPVLFLSPGGFPQAPLLEYKEAHGAGRR
jgi:hypothetical protein